MRYDLVQPCNNCPFLRSPKFYLNRSEEIADALLHDSTFSCHKTTTQKNRSNRHKDAQHCAGALIILEKIGKPHQLMRIAERLGLYDRNKLKLDADVYDTLEEFISGTSY